MSVDRSNRFSRRKGVSAALAATATVGLQGPRISGQEASPMASPVIPADLPLVEVALLTGSDPSAVNQTGTEHGVDGTDLGSSFLYNDLTYIVFGDTFDIAK